MRAATAWVGAPASAVRPGHLGAVTPCGAWAVRDKCGYIVAVLDRLAAIGQGAESVPWLP